MSKAKIVKEGVAVHPSMVDHLGMLNQSLERQGKDYYQMRVLEWTLIEVVGTTHPEDNLSMVFTGFKGKVGSRIYTEQERPELCTRNDMWRESGLLTGHRKAFASALAHAGSSSTLMTTRHTVGYSLRMLASMTLYGRCM